MIDIARLLRVLAAVALTAALAISVTAPAAAEADEAVLEELVALEQSKLEPWYGEASTTAYVEGIADDATYYDPWAPSKLYGPAVVEYLRGFEGNVPPLGFEISDPSVDVRGDVAVFTFDTLNFDLESGEPMGRWMVTKVMNRTDDGWETIHIQYGLPAPPPETPAEE